MASPAGAWSPGKLRWGPAAQPIGRLPVQLYQRRVSAVPLTGGQGQSVVAGWATVTGSATGPGAFSTLATTAVIPPGVYTAAWSVMLGAGAAGAEINNFRLVLGAGPTFLVESVNAGAAGTYPQAPFTFSVPAGGSTLLLTVGPTNGTSGVVYTGTITGQGSATVSVGPQGLGNAWYPASMTVSTTSGVLDTSTCNVYLGPAGFPVTLLGTIYPGGFGTAGFALPSLTPGQYLIAQWTGAKAGDVAAVNVVGTMDSVMPG
jgi:hypothetical protein